MIRVGEGQGKEVRGRRLRGWLESQAHKVLWPISSSLKWGNIETWTVVNMKPVKQPT